MSRIALVDKQKMEYKLLDFKKWVEGERISRGMTQAEIGKALGLTQGRISMMLKTKDKRKKDEKIDPDPFTLGQVIILFDLFEATEETRKKLLTL